MTVRQFEACVAAGKCSEGLYERDKGCNLGTEGRADHPMNCVSKLGAAEYCESVGARLCAEPEWLDACSGADGRAFPYGAAFDLQTCNSGSQDQRTPGRAVGTSPAGAYGGCMGGLPGLYDMAGNVAEWVTPCKGTYCKMRGGSYLTSDPVERFAACQGVCAGNQDTFRSVLTGIRCCKDAPPGAEQ